MSSRRRSHQPRARALRSSITDMSISVATRFDACSCKRTGTRFAARRLALRTVISAAFVAAVAMNAHPRDRPRMLDPFPDEARQVLQGRGPERLDLVEQLVVEHLLHLRDVALEQAEIEHHPRRRVGRAAHSDLGAERMAVDFLALRTQCRSRQRMCCL